MNPDGVKRKLDGVADNVPPVSENDASTPQGESMPESESISVDTELKVALSTFLHFWSGGWGEGGGLIIKCGGRS